MYLHYKVECLCVFYCAHLKTMTRNNVLLTMFGRNTLKWSIQSAQEETYIYTADSPMLLDSLQHPSTTSTPHTWLFLSQPGLWAKYSGFEPNSDLGAVPLDIMPNMHTLLLLFISVYSLIWWHLNFGAAFTK